MTSGRLLRRLVFDAPRGVMSRVRLFFYRMFGLRHGRRNRMEGASRLRHCDQIVIGSQNAFSQGCWLWPTPDPENPDAPRIVIGDGNYFNRNVMIDACGQVTIGDENMFGPDVYIADSNHAFGPEISPKSAPMRIGKVTVGNRCWIGARAVLLSNVRLGDGCVVAAGAVVTRSVAPGAVVGGVPARPIPRPRRDTA